MRPPHPLHITFPLGRASGCGTLQGHGNVFSYLQVAPFLV